jgi:tRNA dimethylallyltransferase
MTALTGKMSQIKNKFLIILLGPTASGKTTAGIKIAKTFQTEIISADSRQFYKELKIGTAVPDKSQMSGITHHFVHTISIHDYYNVSMYEQEVLKILNKLFLKKDFVVMVGGSGMYIDVVCHGIDDLPTIDPKIREKLYQKFQIEGIEGLRSELEKRDPVYYEKADLNNPKRILKALEISIITGTPYSSLLTRPRKARPFKIIKIGLRPDRYKLYDNINQRVDEMITKGLIKEAKSLYKIRHLNALNTVGYKEMFDYFDGKTTLEQAVALIKRNTRRYARRQLTWFNRDKNIVWFNPDDIDSVVDYIKLEAGLKREAENVKRESKKMTKIKTLNSKL